MSEDDPPRHTTETMIPQVYEELRQLASYRMRGEEPGQTISGTALVHEVFLKFKKDDNGPRWANRRQFFSVAAEAMRRLMIDRLRAKRAKKRGGEFSRVEVEESELVAPGGDDELLAIHEALDELSEIDPQGADVVKLRFFAGFNLEEIAESTGVTVRTVSRQWAYARGWLKSRLEQEGR